MEAWKIVRFVCSWFTTQTRFPFFLFFILVVPVALYYASSYNLLTDFWDIHVIMVLGHFRGLFYLVLSLP